MASNVKIIGRMSNDGVWDYDVHYVECGQALDHCVVPCESATHAQNTAERLQKTMDKLQAILGQHGLGVWLEAIRLDLERRKVKSAV